MNSQTGWIHRSYGRSAWRMIRADHKLRGYYHWHEHNLDFITMDNASPEQFDHDQLMWFEKTLQEDAEDTDH